MEVFSRLFLKVTFRCLFFAVIALFQVKSLYKTEDCQELVDAEEMLQAALQEGMATAQYL